MATPKPTIVIIHGGWHTPKTYAKLTNVLKASGYEVHLPRLPSMNEARPPNTDLSTDTNLIRSYVESLADANHRIIALMHSYGGQVGTNALKDLSLETRSQRLGQPTGGVTHLIYMCAFALPEGGSMIGKVREFEHEHLMPLAFDFAEDDSCLCRDPKTTMVGTACDDAEANEYLSTLVRWNGKCMYQEITRSARREIPASYIYTNQDMTVPLEYQKSMVEKMQADGREVQMVELDSGHCPNLTATQGVLEMIDRVVANQAKQAKR